MPKSTRDTQQILNTIAIYLTTVSPYTLQQLLSDLNQMDKLLCSLSKIPWKSLGLQLEMTAHQLYRWYFDNFQRNLYGRMEQWDMNILRKQIAMAIELGVAMDVHFQKLLKQQLSKVYQRNIFTVAFNNTKQTLLKSNELQRHKAIVFYTNQIFTKKDSSK
ncbi:Conserved_hypothetical protein [Hexamita inflata]|uniref:Uncharacterized protein n=1 Tax=Hexamita inflata TaxID=28002 RepID=A0AA86RF19_9EUKA|nr:Conserved hypothetical protein [Hexamita inflata]CAI9972078.1 Conserved hypothetical protein [Hexamita inflata]